LNSRPLTAVARLNGLFFDFKMIIESANGEVGELDPALYASIEQSRNLTRRKNLNREFLGASPLAK
jgi:hypothetical protein